MAQTLSGIIKRGEQEINLYLEKLALANAPFIFSDRRFQLLSCLNCETSYWSEPWVGCSGKRTT